MSIVAIDPGKAGAIACNSNGAIQVYPLPVCELDAPRTTKKKKKNSQIAMDVKKLRDLIVLMEPTVVFLETPILMGVNGTIMAGSVMREFGKIEAVLQLLGLEVRYVRPNEWSKKYGTPDKSLDKDAQRKDLKLQREQIVNRLYPSVKTRTSRMALLDGIVDALCILDWGVNQVKGACYETGT